MVAFESYADASVSSTQAQVPVLTVSAVFFELEHSKMFNQRWAQILEPVLRDEPANKRYFHMTDFYSRKGPYGILKMSDGARDKLQRDLIDALHDHAEVALVASVRTDEFEAESLKDPELKEVAGTAYTMCCIWCIDQFARYVDKAKKSGETVCFFEHGDRDQDDLEKFLNIIGANDYYTSWYRFAGHSFMKKTDHHALAAADLAAWEFRNGMEGYLSNPADFNGRVFLDVLWQKKVTGTHFTPVKIKFRTMAQMFRRAEMWTREEANGTAPENS